MYEYLHTVARHFERIVKMMLIRNDSVGALRDGKLVDFLPRFCVELPRFDHHLALSCL